jgi:hypothetical protein
VNEPTGRRLVDAHSTEIAVDLHDDRSANATVSLCGDGFRDFKASPL